MTRILPPRRKPLANGYSINTSNQAVSALSKNPQPYIAEPES